MRYRRTLCSLTPFLCNFPSGSYERTNDFIKLSISVFLDFIVFSSTNVWCIYTLHIRYLLSLQKDTVINKDRGHGSYHGYFMSHL